MFMRCLRHLHTLLLIASVAGAGAHRNEIGLNAQSSFLQRTSRDPTKTHQKRRDLSGVRNLIQSDTLDDYRFKWSVARICLYLFYLADNIHSYRHAAKDRVFSVEKIVIPDIDEKLTAIRIWTRVRHRYRADLVVIIHMDLILKLVAGISGAP